MSKLTQRQIRTWIDAEGFIHHPQPTLRSDEMDKQYQADLAIDKEIYETTADKIYIDEFGCSAYTSLETGKLKAQTSHGTPKAVLTYNNYKIDTDDAHLVFWFRVPISISKAKELLVDALGTREFIIYQNPRALRSVPDLDHYHIITNPSHLLFFTGRKVIKLQSARRGVYQKKRKGLVSNLRTEAEKIIKVDTSSPNKIAKLRSESTDEIIHQIRTAASKNQTIKHSDYKFITPLSYLQ